VRKVALKLAEADVCLLEGGQRQVEEGLGVGTSRHDIANSKQGNFIGTGHDAHLLTKASPF